MVLGRDRPRYDVLGVPCIRASKLMETATYFNTNRSSSYASVGGQARTQQRCILISEEILLALRPREGQNFWLDDRHPVNVSAGLMGYNLLTHPPPIRPQHRTQVNGTAVDEEESPYSKPANLHPGEEFVSMGEGSTCDSSSEEEPSTSKHAGEIRIHCASLPSAERALKPGQQKQHFVFEVQSKGESPGKRVGNGSGRMNPFEVSG